MSPQEPAILAPRGFGRLSVCDVFPVIDHGAYPAKAVVGEALPVRATIFREGHDAVGGSVVLSSGDGRTKVVDMTQIEPVGLDIWQAWIRLDAEGDWTFHIEAYSDVWRTWRHNAEVKFAAGVDVALMCAEGHTLFAATAEQARESDDPGAASALDGAAALLDESRPTDELVEVTRLATIDRIMRRYAPRPFAASTAEFPLRAERPLAQYGSWYEFFPRSQGAYVDSAGHWVSGTFDDCHPMLERVAEMGFDVVYLPPIHPIGAAFRKGRNNSLEAGPNDPGSPWAIGAPEGGHDAIHPDLGDFAAFDRFVDQARSLGLEVALDFALQASPDHPWVAEHPEWFSTRLDGTIAYAENPPKKYQDIYPINFDNDPDGIYAECLRLLEFWIDRGVTLFRVDNPHTKPTNFWDWLLERIHQDHPDVIFLAEAFSRPAIMQGLAKVGFQQSYTYFTWRNTKKELIAYLTELSQQTAHLMRPNFFVNTPDINPKFTQSGLPAAFTIRLILAATMSPTYGVYSGFELFEHEVLKVGGEEYLNSEKYEYRPRDYESEPNLDLLMGNLNAIRRYHPALQQIRQTTIAQTSNDSVIAFCKTEGLDKVIVVCSLDPHSTVEAEVVLDLAALGLAADASFEVRDELSGEHYAWGGHNFVRLHPANPAHILTIVA